MCREGLRVEHAVLFEKSFYTVHEVLHEVDHSGRIPLPLVALANELHFFVRGIRHHRELDQPLVVDVCEEGLRMLGCRIRASLCNNAPRG